VYQHSLHSSSNTVGLIDEHTACKHCVSSCHDDGLMNSSGNPLTGEEEDGGKVRNGVTRSACCVAYI
jgi:hypothetical protein